MKNKKKKWEYTIKFYSFIKGRIDIFNDILEGRDGKIIGTEEAARKIIESHALMDFPDAEIVSVVDISNKKPKKPSK